MIRRGILGVRTGRAPVLSARDLLTMKFFWHWPTIAFLGDDAMLAGQILTGIIVVTYHVSLAIWARAFAAPGANTVRECVFVVPALETSS